MSTEEAEHGAASELEPMRGIYDCDDAYRTPSQSDYERLFASGIIVLDTNVLINLYRSNERTRKDTFAVIDRVKEQIWIPHQVIAEFWRNRDLPSVRGHHKSKARDTCTALDKSSRAMKDALDRWLRDVHLVNDDVANRRINAAKDAVAETLTDLKQFIEIQARKDALEGTASTLTDPILQRLEPLLEGRVGAPFPEKEHKAALVEATRRAAEKIPPGYEDSSKDPERAAGDYLVWAQLLKEVERRQREVLLVTGDVKEDWWTSPDSRGPARPRTELRAELRHRAGVELYMLTPSQFLTQADQIFGLKVDERSVSDLATSEVLDSAEWPPEELIRVIPQLLASAHERAVEVARVSGLSDGRKSPYGAVIEAAFLESLNEAAKRLGGRSALVHSEEYPVIKDCLLIPFRYADREAGPARASALLSRRAATRRILSHLLERGTQLPLMDVAVTDTEIPGLFRDLDSSVKPVVILYTSNAEQGVHDIWLATVFLYEGGFRISKLRHLGWGTF